MNDDDDDDFARQLLNMCSMCPPFCRTPYNDTINWRYSKHMILIFDENNRFQRKWKYW